MTISVREFKRGLSAYLKRAASGEEVTVTSRGRALVRLIPVPVQTAKEPSLAEIRRRLIAAGIHPGDPSKPIGSRNPTKVKKGQKLISDIVIEDRR